MQVNVFTRMDGAAEGLMLVVPVKPAEPVPRQAYKRWQYIATIDSSAPMFRSVKVEEAISSQGYCVFEP